MHTALPGMWHHQHEGQGGHYEDGTMPGQAGPGGLPGYETGTQETSTPALLQYGLLAAALGVLLLTAKGLAVGYAVAMGGKTILPGATSALTGSALWPWLLRASALGLPRNMLFGGLGTLLFRGAAGDYTAADLFSAFGEGAILGGVLGTLATQVIGSSRLGSLKPVYLVKTGLRNTLFSGKRAYKKLPRGPYGTGYLKKAGLPCFSIGDPVNAITGNFYVTATDLILPGRGLNLEITRHYNSLDRTGGVLGPGWRLSHETLLCSSEKRQITVVYPDGHTATFTHPRRDGLYRSPVGINDTLRAHPDGTFSLQHKNGPCYHYRSDGKLQSITDNRGNETRVTYNQHSQIKTLEAPGGRCAHFYYHRGRLTEIKDESGRVITYSYGDNHRLQQVKLPDGGTITYTLSNLGIRNITDQEGNTFVRNHYDAHHRIIKQEIPCSDTLHLMYDDLKWKNNFTWRPSGVDHEYRYNRHWLLTQKTYPDGTYESCTYDTRGNPASYTDRNGHTTWFKYDHRDNLAQKHLPDGSSVNYYYDEKDRPIRITTSGGSETWLTYDHRGNLVEHQVKIEESKYATSYFTYDPYGRITESKDPEGNITTLYYGDDTISNPTRVTDPEGNEIHFEYDSTGRLESLTNPYGTYHLRYDQGDRITHIQDPEGGVTRLKYDYLGNVKEIIQPESYDPEKDQGSAYRFVYDALDRVTKMINPLEEIHAVKYDHFGNPVKEINPNHYSEETDDGTGISYQYDTDNRRIKTIYPTGGEASIQYDPAGNVIKTIAPNSDGSGMSYRYDELNRLTHIFDPEDRLLKTFTYDADGRIAEETNARGYSTHYYYNYAGWLTEKREPLEEKDGQLLYRVTCYTRDLCGRVVEEKRSGQYVYLGEYPDSWHTITYRYDGNHRVTGITDSTGASIHYTYSFEGRVTREKVKINPEKCLTTHYTYNHRGQVTGVSREIDGEDLSDKKKGKVTAETKLEYDKNGNLVRSVSPEGYQTRYHYDPAGRMIKVEVECYKPTGHI